MADSSIGALPQAPQLDDDSLLVAEQQGQAMKVTGAQFKEFGRQAVIGQVQSYVDAAQAAAAQAAEAVSAVTEMTVEAHASDTATVTKSTRAGKVNLDFGLPRGEKGEPGPAGETGPRGPQGPPGNGLTLLGHYDTEDALRAAVASPEVGDAYSVGLEPPYDVYVFDGVTLDWKNYGPLSGGGGGIILPENVVTTPGGAELEFSSGDGPHTVTFDFEEEPPLTAGDIVYGDGTVQDAISELFTSGSEGKTLIASAVTAKGVETAADASFAELAANIRKIQTGGDTSDATATPGDILAPKTAYTASGKVEGIIPSLPAQTITPGTADKTIANGQYLAGTQTIKGDPNLTSSNIKKGVSIFGVLGAMESSFQATLTVKADIGAVVTATCGDTSVEALSTTGTVVLELPIEGTWKVTAVRGMAQYNTATIVVSSQYSAELTAEVHVEYFIQGTPLANEVGDLGAVSIGDYALFMGGSYRTNASTSGHIIATNAYDKNLTRTKPKISEGPQKAVTATNMYAFCGRPLTSSHPINVIDSSLAYAAEPIAGSATPNSAASIGTHALFNNNDGSVDAISNDLVKTDATPVIVARNNSLAASNDRYAIFADGSGAVDAYDETLTRTNPASLSVNHFDGVGVRAGSYVLICGGVANSATTSVIDAYDLFLTRTNPESLGTARAYAAAATLNDFAVICGGGTYMKEPIEQKNSESYDPYLVRTEIGDLSKGRVKLAATSVGNYSLFAGGLLGGVPDDYGVNTVDVYRYV